MNRRIFWALNHRTLMPDELSVLRELGCQVFTPRKLPLGEEGRSTRLEEGAAAAGNNSWIPAKALALLEEHPFYERAWTPTISEIINRYFDVVVTAFYPTCFSSAVRNFDGLVVARAFGREAPNTYSDFIKKSDLIKGWEMQDMERCLSRMGERYVFGQAYPYLAEVELPLYQKRVVTLPLPAPGWVNAHAGSWHGAHQRLLFNCPIINSSPYYGAIYADIKTHFGDLPHAIFGHQLKAVDDPAVMASPADGEVLDLFSGATAFVYTSPEARHLHYSPIEAAIIGAPVLYMRGALLDRLAGQTLPGACTDLDEMRRKAQILLGGDVTLRNEIRASQAALLSSFSRASALTAWSDLLNTGAKGAA